MKRVLLSWSSGKDSAWALHIRDALGWVNQRLAQEAEWVVFMVTGIPLVVK